MRRALFAFVGTALGTGLLVGAKLGPAPAAESEADHTVELGQPSAAAAQSAPAGPVSSPAPGSAPSAAAPAPSQKPPSKAPPPPPAAGSGLKNGTFAGPGVSQRYGTIKVTVVVSGGRITDVTATYPTTGENGRINAAAIPKLRQQALTAQSAGIAVVSGATYTSNAYKQSLQAAINLAKA